jgi:hypothetical protein
MVRRETSLYPLEGDIMPRVKGQTVSKQGWFRQYFRDHPGAVGTRSNEEVIRSWRHDHPGQDFDNKIQAAMTNVKSNERKKLKLGRRGRKKKAAADGTAPAPARVRTPSGTLERLELAIDRCLEVARAHEEADEDMKRVVNSLRAARNGVVWILGKP